MATYGTDPREDRTIMWAVLLVIGTLVGWAAVGSLVGGPAGFALAAAVAAVAACIGWRHLITFDLLCNVALVGVPAVLVGLSIS